MKKVKCTLLSILFFSLLQFAKAQVQVDKPIQLTGGVNERMITDLEAPVLPTDAVNKAYVDAAVAASGSSMPVMISSESVSTMSLGAALRYCKALTEGGYSDWRLPVMSELIYVLSQGGITVSSDNSSNYIWFGQPITFSNTSVAPWGMRLSDGGMVNASFSGGSALNVRCIR